MNDPDDLSEIYKDMRLEKQKRHHEWYEQNMAILENSGIKYFKNETCLLFRDGIKVDFYPHTGRWKYKNKMHSGGAEKFLMWLKKQKLSDAGESK